MRWNSLRHLKEISLHHFPPLRSIYLSSKRWFVALVCVQQKFFCSKCPGSRSCVFWHAVGPLGAERQRQSPVPEVCALLPQRSPPGLADPRLHGPVPWRIDGWTCVQNNLQKYLLMVFSKPLSSLVSSLLQRASPHLRKMVPSRQIPWLFGRGHCIQSVHSNWKEINSFKAVDGVLEKKSFT